MQARDAGFTLYEVMIAATLLTIWFASLSLVSTSIMNMNELSSHVGDAGVAAQTLIDTLLDTDYDTLSSGTATNAPFALTWTVAENSSPEYKTISVAVAWSDRRGKTHNYSLKSLAYKP